MFKFFKKKKVEPQKPEVKDEIEEDVDKYVNFNYQVLDTIEFLPYIEKFKRKKLIDLVIAVENDYDGTEITNNSVLEGSIFNWLSVEEIKDYLYKRYPKDFRVVEYCYYELA